MNALSHTKDHPIGCILSKVICLIFLSMGEFGYDNTTAEAHRILVAFPHGGRSHFTAVEPLLLELAARGHQLVVISQFPQPKAVPNYTDIDVRSQNPTVLQDPNNKLDIANTFMQIPSSTYSNFKVLYGFLETNNEILASSNFQKLLNSKDEHFDLLFVESFYTRIFYALAHRFQVPSIVFSTTKMFSHTAYDVGNPINPAYVPVVTNDLSPSPMTFWQRLYNVYHYTFEYFAIEWFDWIGEQQKEKYFGADYPPLRKLANNVSLTLVANHFSITGVMPLLPGIVEVGGLFIKPNKPLPQNIEKFLNESDHGVIYFSLGSMLKGASLPEEKRNAFVQAFSQIPQRVLWKWEGDDLSSQDGKIMFQKWMPQRDILAHPNVKLFITHGGLSGSIEAIYEGVPVIGIPFFGDQSSNLAALEYAGMAELLQYNDISKETIVDKIDHLINDSSYRENAQKLSERFKDRPLPPLDTAIYWIEYVLKHKGAPHLRSEALINLPWYSYYLLDVVVFVVVTIILLYFSVKKLLKFLISKYLIHHNCDDTFNKKSK